MRSIKKLIFAFLIGSSTLAIWSCNDFLELEPEFAQDADNYFTSPEHYRLSLTGAYDLVQGSFLHVWIGEIASDNSIAGGESVVDTKGLHDIDAMVHGGVNDELRNVFRWNYAGITRCNFILENQDKIDFTGKSQILAETKFLRGYYYFQLVKFFGDVPLIVDERLGADEVTEKDRASAAEVYGQIESDLTAAISALSPIAPEKGRVTKGAAQSLLGKVYLYQDKYSQAATVLDDVINNGGYALLPDFNTLFASSNEGHSESVFDIQYSGLEGGGYGCLICLEGNAAPGFHGIRQYDGPVYGDGNSYNLPTQDLYNAYGANDNIRRDAAILDIDAFIQAQPNPSAINYAIGGGGHTGYYNNKYIKRQGEIGLPDNDLTSPVNYIVIRYSDVLLMAAEAHNRNGNDAQALTYVNQVRQRVNLPNLTSGGSVLTQDIWKERRLELAGEGHRFFDLVRTGQAATAIAGFTTGKHELFPIPQIEIDLAGNNWNQNPGY